MLLAVVVATRLLPESRRLTVIDSPVIGGGGGGMGLGGGTGKVYVSVALVFKGV
jgi:hypothetical protein